MFTSPPYLIRYVFLSILFFISTGISYLYAQINDRLVDIRVEETAGFSRELEYIETEIQVTDTSIKYIISEDINTNQIIPCQSFVRFKDDQENSTILSVIFPITLHAYEQKTFILRKAELMDTISSDLRISGEETELIIENGYYRADLTQSNATEAKSHYSGQLRELFIKMDFNQLLLRTENRIHWAPNFRKRGAEDYHTIAGWDNPSYNNIFHGPYCIRTERADIAPKLPEMILIGTYKFYAYLPYFIFSSRMDLTQDVWLDLLRNDEMTMDSLFTHIAYQRHDKQVIDLALSTREKVLKKEPISADAPWLCFYNAQKDYAFGSIRIAYDNRNVFNNPSPTYKSHTKISDGSGGGKYWDRRLIHEYPILVPAGSRYYEQNAYLLFEIDSEQKFKHIDFWAQRLRNPPSISLIQYY
jgi:hypothetical protein